MLNNNKQKINIMKAVTFEITNEELFNQLVIDVDTSGLTRYEKYFSGSICIQKEDDNGWVTTTGEFGSYDYDDLGFILK